MSQSYKETLHLPKTAFPMKADLVAREPAMLEAWEKDDLYGQIQAARQDAPLFVLHDGPPFANGDVHMGTALNKILKDLVVKSKTMAGFCAPFVPGWDCHGLPIEFKVVKESTRLKPLEVRRKSEEMARKFIDVQRRQFKRLGVFGDWEHPYLTLDPAYEAEILRAFSRFVERGLVYQSKKPVFWSTGAQTALAEAEVEYAERVDPAIYVEFPMVKGELAGEGSMVIWTTTPWTLPANVAIAVHPRQEYLLGEFSLADGAPARAGNGTHRFLVARELVASFESATGLQCSGVLRTFKGAQLINSEAQHPFLDRTARVIAAEFVTMESGTGQVHIAPGHGADDYVAGVQNKLPILSPVDDHGRFTDEVGVAEWVGKYVFDANPDVIDLLRQRGLLVAEAKYEHSYPHCWRSKTPIVFRAVDQFFIRIDPLRQQALRAIEDVQWIPAWGRNRIFATVESRPDWCISRQRTWGVPLPAFYTPDGEAILDRELIERFAALVETKGSNIWFELDDAQMAALLDLPPGTTRRNDTLDVWIDSGVSHEAVLRTREELAWPADLYLEATDQHRGWFNSSLTTAVALHGRAPYKTCITHGFVVDVDGKKISKSATYQKPMDVQHFVGRHGADLVRLWVSSVNYADDVPFSEEMFTRLADTYRRIRNTLRILLANLNDYDATEEPPPQRELTLVDRWVMARLQELIATCRAGYDSYEFHKVYHAINQFCSVDLSSLYIDITKDRLYCDAADSRRRRGAQAVMHSVVEALIRLVAPILSFTADEAWKHFGATRSVHLELMPHPDDQWADTAIITQGETLLRWRSLIGQAIEQARQAKLIGNTLEAAVTLELAGADLETARANGWFDLPGELEEFFVLSDLALRPAEATTAAVKITPHAKCQRCWRHRPSVGHATEDPQLCDRCAGVVSTVAARA